jgi:hypothetical protein
MRGLRPLALIAAFALLSVGCASKKHAHDALARDGEGSAELIIIRVKHLMAGAVPVVLEMDGEKLVSLRTGRYARLRVEPGTHSIQMREPNTSQRFPDSAGGAAVRSSTTTAAGISALLLKPGGTYFVLVSPVGAEMFGLVFPAVEVGGGNAGVVAEGWEEWEFLWRISLIDRDVALPLMRDYEEIQ